MFNIKNKSLTVKVAGVAALLAGLALGGCRSAASATTAPSSDGSVPKFSLIGPPPHKSGVQIWSENCGRCHNLRPANEFSNQQWAVIVHHMRTRANLTGEEEREVTKFLQASN